MKGASAVSALSITLVMALSLCACESDLTQLVVVVETDFDVPTQLDHVQVAVLGPSGGRVTEEQPVTAGADFPLTLGVRPEADSLGPVRIVAIGSLRGVEVVRRSASVSLVKNHTRMLRLALLHDCAGVTCAETETCAGGACADDSTETEPWHGVPSPRDAGADSGPMDGGDDAALDAATDAAADGGDDAALDAATDAAADGGDDAATDAATDAGVDAGMDACVATPEVCEGSLDEDCDGVVDNGCSCTNGAMQSCPGGSDVGACTRGVQTCGAGAWGPCAGRVDPATEVCEGVVDEDCDGVVDNGCACTNGATRLCVGGVGVCTGGVQNCVAGAWGTCVGATPPGTETCNGLDDDCDGVIDQGSTCIMSRCTHAEFGGHSYLVCDLNQTWGAARTECEFYGYHLVQIETDAENTWLGRQARMVGGKVWIGLTDDATEDVFLWPDGSSACNMGQSAGPPYCNWRLGTPDGGTAHNCVRLNGRDANEWQDRICGNTEAFICEAP